MNLNPLIVSRFESKYAPEPNTGCFLWTGAIDKDGYGTFYIPTGDGRYRHFRAHRYAVMLSGRNIPDNMVCDHLCRNRSCVNPEHIDIVSIGENVRRGTVLITSCPKGHPYSQDNTYIDRVGNRHCRSCRRAADRVRGSTESRREAKRQSYARSKQRITK